jgi:hypothetical protein
MFEGPTNNNARKARHYTCNPHTYKHKQPKLSTPAQTILGAKSAQQLIKPPTAATKTVQQLLDELSPLAQPLFTQGTNMKPLPAKWPNDGKNKIAVM